MGKMNLRHAMGCNSSTQVGTTLRDMRSTKTRKFVNTLGGGGAECCEGGSQHSGGRGRVLTKSVRNDRYFVSQNNRELLLEISSWARADWDIALRQPLHELLHELFESC